MTIEELQEKIDNQQSDVRDLQSQLAQKKSYLGKLRGERLLKVCDLEIGDELKSEDGKKKGIVDTADEEYHFKLRLYKADYTLGKNLVNVWQSDIEGGKWVKTGLNIND